MKRIATFFACCLLATVLYGQQSVSTVHRKVYIAPEVKPALLEMVGDPVFTDLSGNYIIDANETGAISFEVQNTGTGDGIGCEATLQMRGTTNGIVVDKSQTIPRLRAGEKIKITFPFTTTVDTKDGEVTFALHVDEPQKMFGTDTVKLTVHTKSYEKPDLQIVEWQVAGNTQNGLLQKKKSFKLQALMQNVRYGKADDVRIKLRVPDGVSVLDGDTAQHLLIFKGGEQRLLSYELIVTQNYKGTTIPIELTVDEKFHKFGNKKKIELQLNQSLASSPINIQGIEERREEIQRAYLTSKVDKDIPQTQAVNKNTFVVIIANENYTNLPVVPYARNDGYIFSQYCQQTLGIPENQIHWKPNLTMLQMQEQVSWLANVADSYDGEAKLIFYYAGHGAPDVANSTAYLLPIDGNSSGAATGYKLDDIYQTLNSHPAQQVTVFLDACFSGASREGEMLAAKDGLRLVSVEIPQTAPRGNNMVIFSAAQGTETAQPYTDQGHGLFTYFLLEKLQETQGETTYGELSDYINRNVRRQSVLNGPRQTPNTIPSPTLGDSWQGWKLK